jgi:DNA-binding LytR/AlgR family response regulator
MIRCIVIEDEPLAADVLIDYISQVPSLHLVGTCPDAIAAMEVLQREKIDLLFLDIHLPGLKGLDFLETLQDPPRVILTTAYHEYALKGYDHGVVDYLLKPISFKRFVQAVNKLTAPADTREVIPVHSEKKTVLIPVEEILYVESLKEYIKFHTRTSTHVSKYAITRLESELDSRRFLRIHRSFIVALAHVKAFNATEVEVHGKSLPIGGSYRETVLPVLERLASR